MALIAALACATPVDAKKGRPTTSPAAYILGAVVHNFESTTIPPYSSIFTLAAIKFNVEVLGFRPTAARYESHLISVRAPVGKGVPFFPSSVSTKGARSLSVGTLNCFT